MKTLQVNIRPIGNSHGVVIPQPLLAQAGLTEGTADMSIEDGALVLRKPAAPTRQGWAQAAAKIAGHGDDTLVMGEFGNAADKDWVW